MKATPLKRLDPPFWDVPVFVDMVLNYKEFDILYKGIKVLKATTVEMNNSCDFKRGLCRISRMKLAEGQPMHIVRPNCCLDCYWAQGYFHEYEEVVTGYEYINWHRPKFRKDIGYWRAGKGCVLPPELRSIRCVTHYCHADHKSVDKIIPVIDALSSMSKMLRRQYVSRGFKLLLGREIL